MVTEVMPVHSSKAELPMEITELGIVTLVIVDNPQHMQSGILLILLPKLILVKLVQP